MNPPDDLIPGFFGKLPALGDFVQRQLPKTFVSEWDSWLQDGIAASKSLLGENWLDVYLGSPAWRFALSPNIAGDCGWAGVIIPSVDRVGRYFPLTVAARAPGRTFNLVNERDWFDRAETILLSALEEQDFQLDHFAENVAALGKCSNDEGESQGMDDQFASIAWHIQLDQIDHAAYAFEHIAETLTASRLGYFSLWWTAGSELITPSFLLCAGLPEADAFTAMLDGRWQESGWQTIDSHNTSQECGAIELESFDA